MPELDERVERDGQEQTEPDNGFGLPIGDYATQPLPKLEKDTSRLSYIDIIMESLRPASQPQLKDGDKIRLSKLPASENVVETNDKGSSGNSGKLVGKIDGRYDETDRRNDEKREEVRGSAAALESAATKISDIARKVAQLLNSRVLPALDITEGDAGAVNPKPAAARDQSEPGAGAGGVADAPAPAHTFWGDTP
jgi:hypothetical protein